MNLIIFILTTLYLLLFNNIHWDRIREIASICPWLGGEAVYIAQGLIMSSSDINEWDDMDICNTSITPSGARKADINSTEIFNQKIEDNRSKNKSNKVTIYPNPTNEFIYILSANNIKRYTIRDITGKIIIEKAFSNTKINVSNIASGIYFIELIDNENLSLKYKFIKNEK